MLMNSRGGPPFWGCLLMNSRGGLPLGTISMDLAVCTSMMCIFTSNETKTRLKLVNSKLLWNGQRLLKFS